jgi:uncharacterized protein YukE
MEQFDMPTGTIGRNMDDLLLLSALLNRFVGDSQSMVRRLESALTTIRWSGADATEFHSRWVGWQQEHGRNLEKLLALQTALRDAVKEEADVTALLWTNLSM